MYSILGEKISSLKNQEAIEVVNVMLNGGSVVLQGNVQFNSNKNYSSKELLGVVNLVKNPDQAVQGIKNVLNEQGKNEQEKIELVKTLVTQQNDLDIITSCLSSGGALEMTEAGTFCSHNTLKRTTTKTRQ